MSVNSSQSRVTITLNLTGQARTIRGIQQTEAALQSLGDTATAVAEKVGTATAGMAAKVDTANRTVTTSADTAAASMKAQADATAAAAGKSATASEDAAARTVAANKTAAGSITSLLTSWKALSVGAATYLGVKSYTGYSTALTQLSTLAGMTQGQVAALNNEILRTSTSLRQSPTALAQAAYSPASERFGLAGTEQVMRYAAQLTNISGNPIGGGAGSTSYAISTMLQTLGWKPTAQNVAKAAAMIRGATSAGDMQLTDLTGAMTTGILNTGKTYGISPEATLGALAYFTSQGVPAQEAATRMRMTESLLVGQTAQAAKYGSALGLTVSGASESALSQQLAGLGLTSTRMSSVLSSGPGGLNAAFQMISQSISRLPQAQQEAVWAKLFGGGRTDATAMQLAQGAMSGKLMDFTNAVIGSSTVGGLSQANAQYNKSPQGQLKQFESELATFATQFGAVVMPVLEQLMGILGPLLSLFAHHKSLLTALTLLIGGELALKLGGLVRDLKLVKATGSAIRDLKAFDGIVTGAHTAETAVGKLLSKLLDTKSAVGGIGSTEAAGGAGSTLGGAALGIGAGGALATAGTAGVLGLAAWGIFGGRQARAMSALLPAGATPGQVRAGTNYAALTPAQWAQVAANAKTMGYARGGVTNGPMAIVGEGRSQFPEYVIPTDPQYRGRALGLFASLGGHLLAEGGTVSASEVVLSKQLASDAMPGLSLAERTLNQTIAMMVGSAQASTLTKLANSRSGAGTTAATALAALAAGGSRGPASPASNKSLAQRLAAGLGWTGQEWAALNALWMQESGFSNTATNPSSGAYGIAQALPASKYPLAGQAAGGSDPTAQIRWGLQYIQQRYGDPLGAEGHEQRFGWYRSGGVLPFASYDSGGFLPEGISLAHNGTGAPEPVGHDLVGAGVHIEGGLHFHGVTNGKQAADVFIKELRHRAARR